MKNKFKFVALTLLFSLLTASASVVGYTHAAYLNEGKYHHPLDINTNTFTSYFYGGNGTEDTPYLINTPDHLRNLQKLTKLGVFHANTFFSLSAGFRWDGDPLLPIGSEDTPFNSQFNGMGYAITGLVVHGANTNDIGMFGYVGINGRLRNLVLNAPVIHINANTGGTRLATINPLENIFGNYARNTFGKLTRVSSTSNSVTFSTPNTSVISPSLNGGNPIDIVYESSNTNLLYQSTTNAAQWITKSTSGAAASDIFPVHLQARVYAQYDNKIISYTLERWQINVNGNGTVANDATGFYKTMYPVDGHHEVYVGFFAGHLDGGASYLGLWGGNASGGSNGLIYLNGRSARSYNVLVGRSRDDNDLDSTAANFYSRFVDINTLLNSQPNFAFNPSPAISALDTTAKIQTYNTAVANHNKNYYGLTTNEAEFIRLYPPLNHVIGTTFKTTDHEGNVLPGTTTGNTARYNTQFKARTYRGTFNQRATVASSLWFWATKQYVSIFDSIFSESQFQLQFRLTYFVNNTTSTANQFKVLINTFSSTAILGILAVGTNYWTDAQALGYYVSSDYPLITSTNLVNVLQEKTIILNVTTGSSIFGNTPLIAIGVGKGDKVETPFSNSIYETSYPFDPYELNIISFDVLVTSADGNISSLLNFVDILHTAPTRTQTGSEVTFSNWSKASNTKIQFNGMNFNNVMTATTYRFWRTAGFGSTGINSTVNGRFTTGTPYTLTNTSGYAIATLEAGA